jgi:hypothetical protein
MRRTLIVFIILLFSYLLSAKDLNEWRAEGRVIGLAVEGYDGNRPSLVVFELCVGKNKPALCIATGEPADALYRYWREHKDCACRCRIGIIGRLRITGSRYYVRVREWGPAPPWSPEVLR